MNPRMKEIYCIIIITDTDMHLFSERGIRGGVSMISQRFAAANNIYAIYNREEASRYIIHWNANNL